MNEITTLALDLAKSVFQVHGVDARGQTVLQRQLRRVQLHSFLAQLPVCTVAMEACSGAHYWGRVAQRCGHQVHLVPAQFVKAFLRGQKNDRNDAQAVAEASRQPGMTRVAVKSEEQQAMLAVHRIRLRMVRERTAGLNQLHGLLGEFGLVLPRAKVGVLQHVRELLDTDAVPVLLRAALSSQLEHLAQLHERIKQMTAQLQSVADSSGPCRQLMKRRGVGPIVASAFVAELGNAAQFKNGRQVAAWLGLVPRQHSTGGATRLYGITKRGDPYLRQLLVHGARSVMNSAPRHPDDPLCRWGLAVRERRGANRATVAMANKLARHIWASLRYEAA